MLIQTMRIIKEQYPEGLEQNFMDQFDSSLDSIGHPGSNYAYGTGFSQRVIGSIG